MHTEYELATDVNNGVLYIPTLHCTYEHGDDHTLVYDGWLATPTEVMRAKQVKARGRGGGRCHKAEEYVTYVAGLTTDDQSAVRSSVLVLCLCLWIAVDLKFLNRSAHPSIRVSECLPASEFDRPSLQLRPRMHANAMHHHPRL